MTVVSTYMNIRKKFGKEKADEIMFGSSQESKKNEQPEVMSASSMGLRRSYFTPEDNIFNIEPQEDGEAMQNGIDIIKKRRGSIFGNNTGTIFGN